MKDKFLFWINVFVLLMFLFVGNLIESRKTIFDIPTDLLGFIYAVLNFAGIILSAVYITRNPNNWVIPIICLAIYCAFFISIAGRFI